MEDMGDMEMDMESMMGGGDGKVKSSDSAPVQLVVLSNIEQSCRALQQMGVILSRPFAKYKNILMFVASLSVVALLVSVLFLVMMGIENLYNAANDWMKRSKGKGMEEKNPAELVGTFKRYK